MTTNNTAILLAGPVTGTERLRAQLAGLPVIAADSGIRHAVELGLDVDLWVGDFDSTPQDIGASFATVEKRVYPSDKDITDGNIAIEAALEAGAGGVILVGGLGGETAHALGHLTMAVDLCNRGIEVLLTSGFEEARPIIAGTTHLDFPAGSGLAIVGLTDLTGLSLEGVRWGLSNRDVPLGSTLTLSNRVTGPVTVQLKRGRAIAVSDLAGLQHGA